jgi:hypothetical protein
MREVIIIASKMKSEDKWQLSAFFDIKKVAKFEPWNNNPAMDVKIFKIELPLNEN